ncbi:hypothetical protein ACIQU4_39415 [Streptomyces sp. NPDC090741]|uniref:hypothetical protein n=1 Tax=Streptomyces sp. NPDC090741 TaxID=3365967 RepID=UPI0037FF5B23
MTGTDSVLGGDPLYTAADRGELDPRLAGFLDRKARAAAEQGLPGELVDVLRALLFSGGKRVRPPAVRDRLARLLLQQPCGRSPAAVRTR